MSNSEKGDFYFGISDKKFHICFFEKGKSQFKETLNFEIPDSLNNNLNFKIIINLLKKNIRKIEKDLGFFCFISPATAVSAPPPPPPSTAG